MDATDSGMDRAGAGIFKNSSCAKTQDLRLHGQDFADWAVLARANARSADLRRWFRAARCNRRSCVFAQDELPPPPYFTTTCVSSPLALTSGTYIASPISGSAWNEPGVSARS